MRSKPPAVSASYTLVVVEKRSANHEKIAKAQISAIHSLVTVVIREGTR